MTIYARPVLFSLSRQLSEKQEATHLELVAFLTPTPYISYTERYEGIESMEYSPKERIKLGRIHSLGDGAAELFDATVLQLVKKVSFPSKIEFFVKNPVQWQVIKGPSANLPRFSRKKGTNFVLVRDGAEGKIRIIEQKMAQNGREPEENIWEVDLYAFDPKTKENSSNFSSEKMHSCCFGNLVKQVNLK